MKISNRPARPRPIWQDLVWGGRVLVARGAVDDAIEYLGRRADIHTPAALARFAEECYAIAAPAWTANTAGAAASGFPAASASARRGPIPIVGSEGV
jgi:hypothetical protein